MRAKAFMLLLDIDSELIQEAAMGMEELEPTEDE